jgi:hypothetical protein
VQCADLTDDELLHTIAENTAGMSDLIDCRLQLDGVINGLNDRTERSELMNYYVRKLNSFEAEYRSCTAELRRRHPLYAS